MMVTIGGLGTCVSSSSTSATSSISICFSMSMNSTSYPNSLATSSITSASRRWLIDTIIPRFIHLEITSAILASISDASSLTLMNSVTCSFSSICSPMESAISSRFARRYFAFRLLPRPVCPASLACVCLIFSWISFLSISLPPSRFFSGLNLEGPAGLCWPPCWGLLPPCCGCPCPVFNTALNCPEACCDPFFSMGIRLRLRFSSRLRAISFSTGNSILPMIFGPSSSGASIFRVSSTTSFTSFTSSTGSSTSATGSSTTGSSTTGASSTFSLSTFLLAFLGRVEESMASRSILSRILGPATSGTSIFKVSVTTTSGSGFTSGTSTTIGSTTASTTGAAASAFFLLSFLKRISSSSFFFFASATLPFGISI